MTTIAYKDGVIAVDSYCTAGDIVVNAKAVKVEKHNGVTFVFAGDGKDRHKVVSGYFGDRDIHETNARALIVDNGSVFDAGYDEEGQFLLESVIEECYAIGSGMRFALGAMDAGCSAVEAVKIACNRDIYSGGRVRTVKVK